jgi:hypothetical protein
MIKYKKNINFISIYFYTILKSQLNNKNIYFNNITLNIFIYISINKKLKLISVLYL